MLTTFYSTYLRLWFVESLCFQATVPLDMFIQSPNDNWTSFYMYIVVHIAQIGGSRCSSKSALLKYPSVNPLL